jgi:hypothetical protein
VMNAITTCVERIRTANKYKHVVISETAILF